MAKIEKKSISKKALFKSYINWVFFHISSFSFERMEGLGFCKSMMPIAMDLYPDDKEKRLEMYQRHSEFFNTEPVLGTAVPGIIAGIEENKANGADVDDSVINGVKAGLMGPLAGIGDSFFQGLLAPILLSIGIGLASSGSIVGPLFYIFTFFPIAVAVSYYVFYKGYKMGINSTELFLGKKAKAVQEAMKVMGLIVIGAIGASYVGLSISLTIPMAGGDPLSVQGFIDKLFPNLLPLAVLVLSWFLIGKKHVKPTYAIIGVIVLSGVGVLLGIF